MTSPPARTGDGEREALIEVIRNVRLDDRYCVDRVMDPAPVADAIFAAGFRRDHGWIACSERMPESFTGVMVKVLGNSGVYPRHMTTDDAGLWEDEWGHKFDGSDPESTVTHWRPLHSPPGAAP